MILARTRIRSASRGSQRNPWQSRRTSSQIPRRDTEIERLSSQASRHSTRSTRRAPKWWKIRLFHGMYEDVKRRLPYYWSDWRDAWDYRVVPATVYMYFAKYDHNMHLHQTLALQVPCHGSSPSRSSYNYPPLLITACIRFIPPSKLHQGTINFASNHLAQPLILAHSILPIDPDSISKKKFLDSVLTPEALTKSAVSFQLWLSR